MYLAFAWRPKDGKFNDKNGLTLPVSDFGIAIQSASLSRVRRADLDLFSRHKYEVLQLLHVAMSALQAVDCTKPESPYGSASQ